MLTRWTMDILTWIIVGLRYLAACARAMRHRHPFNIFCYVYGAFLAFIAVSGGGNYHVAGKVIELRSILLKS